MFAPMPRLFANPLFIGESCRLSTGMCAIEASEARDRTRVAPATKAKAANGSSAAGVYGPLRKLLGCLAVVASSAVLGAELPPIVVGQSLPLRGMAFFSASRVLQGAQAYAGHVNATGGINGRRLELVTLDDENDPRKLAANLRTLARQHGALAFLNCLGDALCQEASRVSEELRVPLVGPHSGAVSLHSSSRSYTVPLRPAYGVQTDALQRQLQSMGITRVVILTSYSPSAELRTALLASLSRSGTTPAVIQIDDAVPASFDEAAERLKAAAPEAVVLDVSHAALRRLGELEASQRFTWPRLLATVSPGNLTQLTQEIRSRLIGFVNVVPNPEDSRWPLARELDAQAQLHSGPQAITFEGVEGYVNLRVLVEALRRAGPAPTADATLRTVENLREVNLGGFRIRIGAHAGGPNWIDVGLRSREGVFIR